MHREPEEEEDQSKAGKVPFWWKKENAAERSVSLRGCRATESDGDASQIPLVPNGTKGYVSILLLRIQNTENI